MKIKSVLSSVAVAAALACASGQSFAASAFCVDDSAVSNIASDSLVANDGNLVGCSGVGGASGFKADLLTGNYFEKLRLFVDPGTGAVTFKATILADWNAYSLGGASLEFTGLNFPASVGGYDLYAVVTAEGTVTGGGVNFSATNASFNLYLDDANNTVMDLNSIDSGTLNFVAANQGDDLLLGGSTVLLNGEGTTAQTGGDDGFAVTFGEFVLSNIGANVTDGERFFIAPRPFYMTVYSDGDISNEVPSLDPLLRQFTGELSAEFLIPEPGSLALTGLALVGLGIARRRKA